MGYITELKTYVEFSIDRRISLEVIENIRKYNILYKLSDTINNIYLGEKSRVSSNKYVLFYKRNEYELNPFSAEENEYRRISIIYKDNEENIEYDDRKLIFFFEDGKNDEWEIENQVYFVCCQLLECMRKIIPKEYDINVWIKSL